MDRTIIEGALTAPNLWFECFEKVTSTNDLEPGLRYVIACGSKSMAAGAMGSGTYLSHVSVSIKDDVLTSTDNVAVFVLEQTEDGWTFQNESTNQYLVSTAAKNVSYSSTASVWTLSDGTDGVIMTAGSNGTMLYNNGSPRFTTYTSDPTATMIQANLYMEDSSSTPVTPDPLIVADETLTFSTTVGTPQTKTFEVLSEGLTEDITVTLSGTDRNLFSLGSTTISRTASELGATGSVTFTPTSAGTFSATVTLTSAGAAPVTIALTATATAADDPTPSGETLFYEGLTEYDSSGDATNELASNSPHFDYTGWTDLAKVYAGGTSNAYDNGGCLKFGSSKASGSMTTGSISLTGSGTLTIVPRNSVSRVRIEGGWNNFEGTIVHNTNLWLPMRGNVNAPKMTLQIASGSAAASSPGYTYTIGAVTGGGDLTNSACDFNSSSAVSGNVTWNLGNNLGKDFTFAGRINDNSATNYCTFNKVGSCTMTYTGAGMNITRAVNVNGGLVLDSASGADLGSGTLTLKSGATLTSKASTLRSSSITAQSGSAMSVTSCTFNGASMNFQSGSSLTVGDSQAKTIGTLNGGSANITINNGASCEMYIYKNAQFSAISTTGTLTLSGTFKLSYNTSARSGVVPKNLPSFKLVDAGNISLGSNFAFDLQELPTGYYWDTRAFATEGTISITNVDPTGVNEVKAVDLGSDELTEAYTLSGVYVGRPTKPGIYVQNGQKYLVK